MVPVVTARGGYRMLLGSDDGESRINGELVHSHGAARRPDEDQFDVNLARATTSCSSGRAGWRRRWLGRPLL
jgi:hypothetical protein